MTMFDGSQNGQPWMTRVLSGLLTSSAVLGSLGGAAGANAANCDRYHAIYTDVNQRGFELHFGPADPGARPPSPAAATIYYQNQPIYQGNLAISSGYSTLYFMGLPVYFFNTDLTTPTTDSPEPPGIVFIAGLGSHDYYARRREIPDATHPYLLETLWQFDRCPL
ncbi:hypothetical protein P7L53_17950 [Thermoleptolyngbya sichuanensis XZ-Cy5]|uniref:hypothetical protein n=1 Tax=Thermoleptolyngbya sichuanensis TaxID=2885951 RepID=UPI00240D0136|nr:hypothetical protein [Thermoleptolyngbya sichuanensis]MDG2618128.1 hypothetical protein [Thermoleptolyngbya sichuanensis XZ-Cy5]